MRRWSQKPHTSLWEWVWNGVAAVEDSLVAPLKVKPVTQPRNPILRWTPNRTGNRCLAKNFHAGVRSGTVHRNQRLKHHFSQWKGMEDVVRPHARILLFLVTQSCLTLCNPMDCSPSGSSVLGFPRQQYWSGLPSSPGDLPRDCTCISCIAAVSLPLSHLGSPVLEYVWP